MDKYTELPLAAAKQMLKILKSATPLKECYKQIFPLWGYSGYITVNDVHGLVGEAGGKAFEGGSGDDWRQIGMEEEHWLFGPADLIKVGCFKDNVSTYLSRADMVKLIDGHVKSFKPQAKVKATRTLQAAEAEISRLQKLLKDNGIKF